MCFTDRHDMTLAVKVALNPVQLTNQFLRYSSVIGSKDFFPGLLCISIFALFTGLPPSNFGGRGRGYGKGSNVPPIHSLAKGKPSFPDFRKMSSAEKVISRSLSLFSNHF